jgi:hypothetical protein
LPTAVVPLWQVAHAAAVPLWLNRAPANVTVLLWQVSHGALVATCRVGLPTAVVPLWQVAHAAAVPLWLNRAPANITVLLWQDSHGALVTTWRGGFPIAFEPSWHDAHRPRAVAWLNFARPDDGPAAGSPSLNSLVWGIAGAAPGTTGAILAKFEGPGTAAGADAVGAVADGANSAADTGLLLKSTFAAGLGEDGVAVGAGLVCGSAVAGAWGCVVAAVDGEGWGTVLPDPPVTERTAVVTAATVRVTVDCIADLTTAMVVDFVVGASALAVVTQPPTGFCVLSQLVNVVAAWTWQQPQSCAFAP